MYKNNTRLNLYSLILLLNISMISFSCSNNANSGSLVAANPVTDDSGGGDILPPSCSIIGQSTLTNNMNASYVLGQADFTSVSANRGGAVAANTLNAPIGIAVKDNRLFVGDGTNNRILEYNLSSIANGSDAILALGQNTLTSNAAATSSRGLSGVQGISINDDYIITSEWANRRTLFFSLTGLSTGSAASFVLGKMDFITSASGLTASLTSSTVGSIKVGTKYVVLDSTNNRVLIYDGNSLANGLAASVVIGQTDFTSNTDGTTLDKMDFPLGLASNGTNLLIVDANNNRILVYNSLPTTNGASADYFIGGYSATATATHLNFPVGAYYDGTKLFVADRSNHRVLVWNSLPLNNTTPADVVIGQPNFTSGSANQGASAAANTLNQPHMIHYDGCRLYVADRNNNRVLIY